METKAPYRLFACQSSEKCRIKQMTLLCLLMFLLAPAELARDAGGASVPVSGPDNGRNDCTAASHGQQITNAAGVPDRTECEATPGLVPEPEAYIPTPRPLPAGVPVAEHTAYAQGGHLGVVAESRGSFLVYSSTRGKHAAGPADSAATAQLADDIAITARADCPLDKYVLRVTGDRENTGAADLFDVSVALYKTCPGAAKPTPIAGTTCDFYGLSGTGVQELACIATTTVTLPDNFYVGVAFSRDNCGAVVGAPSELGFSADRLDWPGFACNAWFGGFPDSRHASFWLQVYTTENCDKSFVAYKNSNHAGSTYSAGPGVRFADDIRLSLNTCNMIAYEVSLKGPGFYQFDIRTFLSNADPATGGVIPGTEKSYLSISSLPQTARFSIDPPIPMPPNFYVVFRSSNDQAGPIFTSRPADLGSTEDLYAVYRNGQWVVGPYSDTTYAAFDVTIVCEGEPPVGACCDMVLVDDQNEAVCEHLPEMNCAQDPAWGMWVEDVCDDVCVGGTNNGQPCTRAADCPGYSCVGGARNGLACDPSKPAECPGGFCRKAKCPGPFPFPCGQSACCTHDDFCYNYTENECYARPPIDKPRTYHRGQFCGYQGFACPWPHGCPWNVYLYCPWASCDPYCCAACCRKVCEADSWCCIMEWDPQCTMLGNMICDLPVSNDNCWDPDPYRGARLVGVPSSTESDHLHATESATDPGFCCHNETPGAIGYGTVWYKFVATQASASVRTCFSNAPATDSLLSVYEPADPDRGICEDSAQCSIAAQNCTDGSDCVLDEQYACEHLNLIGCSDDVQDCSASNKNSSLCLGNLVVGQTYYVLVASKPDISPGDYPLLAYRLDVSAPCTPDELPIPNDYCQDAAVLPSRPHVVEPFDLSGGEAYAPATFDCPAEPCVDPVMRNDLWYAWTAPCDGPAKVTTCDPELLPGYQPETSMAVYDACNCPVQVGTAVACNAGTLDDCGLSATVVFDASRGKCYMIRLGGHNGETPAGDLTVDVACPACPDGPVAFVDPPDGVIDARQPHPPQDATQRQGIGSITVEGPPGIDQPHCWTLCETSVDGTPNAITSIADNGDGRFTISLARTISVGAVTALTYTDGAATSYRAVFTSHPANVDADSASGPVDMLAIIDILNGVRLAPWNKYSCDVDHSGLCNAADILRLIDLLNGADQFDPWIGRALPQCGACCP